MSVGNAAQTVNLDIHGLTLVLGENIDQGGNSSRNGAGKTTILNALSYALFGSAITYIKKDNLINKTNNKTMIVSVEFEKGGRNYRVERGRKPNFFRFYVDDGLVNSPDTDEAQGENRWTQQEVESVIGFSHLMFKHIIALNTYTEPFLAMRAGEQRIVIEELLGLTQLSQKAEELRELTKGTKDKIKQEEYRISAVQASNNRIQAMINDLKLKSELWVSSHKKKIQKLDKAIDDMKHVSIEEEIKFHKDLKNYLELESEISRLSIDKSRLERTLVSSDVRLSGYEKDLEGALEHKCPTCGQQVHDDQHDKIIEELRVKIKAMEDDLTSAADEFEETVAKLAEKNEKIGKFEEKPAPHYDRLDEAYNHKTTLVRLDGDLGREKEAANPELENIGQLESEGLQEVSYEEVNDLTKLKEHQDFLLKLLVNKDSFIRKKLIDQNLAYLNHQLKQYLERINLPHSVVFQNDLSVEITELGRELDFYNLSRGESNRLILGLSWAFRDIWESLNQPINLLFIDELVDSGMDSFGVESALAILKKMSRDKGKNIFLISHREELISRVSSTLMVRKENGFTSFDNDVDSIA